MYLTKDSYLYKWYAKSCEYFEKEPASLFKICDARLMILERVILGPIFVLPIRVLTLLILSVFWLFLNYNSLFLSLTGSHISLEVNLVLFMIFIFVLFVSLVVLAFCWVDEFDSLARSFMKKQFPKVKSIRLSLEAGLYLFAGYELLTALANIKGSAGPSNSESDGGTKLLLIGAFIVALILLIGFVSIVYHLSKKAKENPILCPSVKIVEELPTK